MITKSSQIIVACYEDIANMYSVLLILSYSSILLNLISVQMVGYVYLHTTSLLHACPCPPIHHEWWQSFLWTVHSYKT